MQTTCRNKLWTKLTLGCCHNGPAGNWLQGSMTAASSLHLGSHSAEGAAREVCVGTKAVAAISFASSGCTGSSPRHLLVR